MAVYTIIPDSTYSSGESTTDSFTVPAGETTLRCMVSVFTMGNDADTLTVRFEHSDDGITWLQKGQFEFYRAVRGGGGQGAWMTQYQNYGGIKPFCRLRSSVQGSGRYSATFELPAPIL